MNTIQTGIITLIKSGITGEKLSLPENFNLQEAYKEIMRHGIAALAYTGAVYCGIPKGDPTMKQLFAIYIKQMMRSEQQMAEVDRILKAFDENSIDYLPLKGIHMKQLYPKPELRQMGDADILIKEDSYPQAEQILKVLGFTFKSINPHEYTWLSDNLYLELHTYMFSFTLKDFYRYYEDSWKLAKPLNGSHHEFISPEDEFIYLFTHYAKHYRAGGIGLRHLTDLWVFRRAYPELSESKITEILQSLKLDEFYKNTMDLLGFWFENKTAEKAEFMSEYIFASGNWGTVQSHALSEAIKSTHDTGDETYSRGKSLVRTAFPPIETMSIRYPVLKKHPILLPACWACRIGVAVFSRQENIKRLWKANQYSTSDRIETFQAALDYVGLGFDF